MSLPARLLTIAAAVAVVIGITAWIYQGGGSATGIGPGVTRGQQRNQPGGRNQAAPPDDAQDQQPGQDQGQPPFQAEPPPGPGPRGGPPRPRPGGPRREPGRSGAAAPADSPAGLVPVVWRPAAPQALAPQPVQAQAPASAADDQLGQRGRGRPSDRQQAQQRGQTSTSGWLELVRNALLLSLIVAIVAMAVKVLRPSPAAKRAAKANPSV